MTEWGPITDHDGGACPIAQGRLIRVWMGSGVVFEGRLHHPSGDGWRWDGPADPYSLSHVLAYQLARPKGVQMVCDVLHQFGDPQIAACRIAARVVP